VDDAPMSVSMRSTVAGVLPQLRYEPTGKRIRAVLDGTVVADTGAARLVWEPRRIVPSWAVPERDLQATLGPAEPGPARGDEGGVSVPSLSDRPVLDPSVPFAAHTADGASLDVTVGSRTLPAAGFRPADPDLSDYVVLDFRAFDEWWEEDVRNLGHPRDPFHRVDALPSSRHVRVELDGELLAESTRAVLLFETLIPTTRFYLPPEDVRAELTPSATTSVCAYKGQAAYFSVTVGGREHRDIAWTYRAPLIDATPVKDLVAFFDERVDVTLDGEPLPRPRTPWSR
jgi:uncharacterized protein (DUF427 family)